MRLTINLEFCDKVQQKYFICSVSFLSLWGNDSNVLPMLLSLPVKKQGLNSFFPPILQFNKRCLSGKLVVLDHCSNSSSNIMQCSSRLLPTVVVTAETWIHSSQTCPWSTMIQTQGVMLSMDFAFETLSSLWFWEFHIACYPRDITILWLLVTSWEGSDNC
jgi:hypothetical protein